MSSPDYAAINKSIRDHYYSRTLDQMACDFRGIPITQLFPQLVISLFGFRGLRRIVRNWLWRLWREFVAFVRRVVEELPVNENGAAFGSSCAQATTVKYSGLQEFIRNRPWTTSWDWKNYIRGWDEGKAWAISQSLPGKCGTCMWWKHGINQYGTCQRFEGALTEKGYEYAYGVPVRPAFDTVAEFGCTKYELRIEEQRK